MSVKSPKKGYKRHETDNAVDEPIAAVVRLGDRRNSGFSKLPSYQRRLPPAYTLTGETFQLRPGVQKSAIDVLQLA